MDVFDRAELGKQIDDYLKHNHEAAGVGVIKLIAQEVRDRALSGQKVIIRDFISVRKVTLPARQGTTPDGKAFDKPERQALKIKSLL